MIVLFHVLSFVLTLITQQLICGTSWQDYVYIGGYFRSDFCHPALSVVQPWPGPKDVGLKSFALYDLMKSSPLHFLISHILLKSPISITSNLFLSATHILHISASYSAAGTTVTSVCAATRNNTKLHFIWSLFSLFIFLWLKASSIHWFNHFKPQSS